MRPCDDAWRSSSTHYPQLSPMAMFGGGIAMIVGTPALALVLLVFLKITIDLLAHRQDSGAVDRAEELVF